MGKNERQAYLKAIRLRYSRAGKQAKTKVLDEFCAVCGYHRKYAIRLLNRCGKPRKRRRVGRKPIYAGPELLTALKRIWFACDQMCSKKLKAAIPLWLPFYETVYKPVTLETRRKLISVSAATIDRLLRPVRLAHGRRGLVQNNWTGIKRRSDFCVLAFTFQFDADYLRVVVLLSG